MDHFHPENLASDLLSAAIDQIKDDDNDSKLESYFVDEPVSPIWVRRYNMMIADVLVLMREHPLVRNQEIEQWLIPKFHDLEDDKFDPKSIRFFEYKDDIQTARLLYFHYTMASHDDINQPFIVLEYKEKAEHEWNSDMDDTLAISLLGSHPEIASRHITYINSDGSGYLPIEPNIEYPSSLLVSLLTAFVLFSTDAPH